MGNEQISKEQRATLKHLRSQVDHWAERRFGRRAAPEAHVKYDRAREELKVFVESLRAQGVNI